MEHRGFVKPGPRQGFLPGDCCHVKRAQLCTEFLVCATENVTWGGELRVFSQSW